MSAPTVPGGDVGRAIEGDLAAVAADVSLTAEQRLKVSRERMRMAMVTPSKPARASFQNGAGGARRSTGPSWWEQLKHVRGATVIVETLENWWRRSPWRTPLLVAAEASRTLMQPVARKSPFILVAAALVAGAAVGWLRPWRWIIKPALFAGIAPQIARRVVSNLPIESWMGLIARLTEPRQSRDRFDN
ncbi:hypothetical protein BH11PSE8_BH11PSE8_03800 [soil metagenome]